MCFQRVCCKVGRFLSLKFIDVSLSPHAFSFVLLGSEALSLQTCVARVAIDLHLFADKPARGEFALTIVCRICFVGSVQ